MTRKPILDDKGRLVLPATRDELRAMTDEEVQVFRAQHVQSGYGGLVQAADEEMAERKNQSENGK
jgi:DNA-binding transcriptional regulator/RsmH inhibitor MraZ